MYPPLWDFALMIQLPEPIRKAGGYAMSEPVNRRQNTEGHPPGVQEVLHWARCHPGMLVVGSLAVAALLTRTTSELEAEVALQTEADFVDGEAPLFI